MAELNFTGLNEERAKYYLNWLKKYFYGVYSKEEIEHRFFHSLEYLNKDWKNKPSEIEFYKKTNHYIFNLLYWHSMTNKINIMRELAEFFKDAQTVLDFGAGIGVDSNELKNLGYDVTAFDFDCHSLNAGMFLFPLVKFTSSWYYNEKYDVVLAMDVIGHVPDVKKILDELISRTKKYLVIGLDLCCFDTQPMHHKENAEWQTKTQTYLEDKGFENVGQVQNNIVMRKKSGD